MRGARVVLLLLALAAGLRSAAPAHAQHAAALERLEIALWPEYDRPALLVIYRATLPESTPLPAQITLPVPAQAGEPTAVAFADDQGQLLLTSYSRTVDGDWATLVIRAPSPRIQVEYYLDIALDGMERRIEFGWPGGVSAAQAGFEVQEPAGSSALEIDPAPQRSRLGPDGLTIHSGDLGPLAADSTFDLRVRYSGAAPAAPEASSEPAPAASPVDAMQENDAGARRVLAWALLAVGVVLLAGGVTAGWRIVRRGPDAARRAVPPGAPSASAVFCHACGARAVGGDVHCRCCGTRLRR